MSRREWTWAGPRTCVLPDEHGRVLRQVAVLGPYLGEDAETYTVTGPGHDTSEHQTFHQGVAAAEASLADA